MKNAIALVVGRYERNAASIEPGGLAERAEADAVRRPADLERKRRGVWHELHRQVRVDLALRELAGVAGGINEGPQAVGGIAGHGRQPEDEEGARLARGVDLTWRDAGA